MMFSVVFLLILITLFFGTLAVTIFCAVTAKTTGGRTASILVGVFLLLLVPLGLMAFLMVMPTSVTRSVPQQSRPTKTTSPPLTQQLSSNARNENKTVPPPAITVTPKPTPPDALAPPEAFVPPEAGPSPSVWRASDTDTFHANLYPSYEAAIKPLIDHLQESLVKNQIFNRDEKNQTIVPETILLTAFGSTIEPLVPQVTQQIRSLYPESDVQSGGKAPPNPSPDMLSIHLATEQGINQPAPWDNSLQIEQAVLSCDARLGTNTTSVDCFVTEKPWVETFDRFVSMYPLRSFVVGYSGEFRSSEGEARGAALADAMRQASIEVDGKRLPYIDDRHVVDRFAQQLSRPYGEVWREAVLVELPTPPQVAVARMKVEESFRSWVMVRISQQIGIVILVFAIILLCLSLNWVTKGYYRGQVVLGFVGAAVLCLFLAALFIS